MSKYHQKNVPWNSRYQGEDKFFPRNLRDLASACESWYFDKVPSYKIVHQRYSVFDLKDRISELIRNDPLISVYYLSCVEQALANGMLNMYSPKEQLWLKREFHELVIFLRESNRRAMRPARL